MSSQTAVTDGVEVARMVEAENVAMTSMPRTLKSGKINALKASGGAGIAATKNAAKKSGPVVGKSTGVRSELTSVKEAMIAMEAGDMVLVNTAAMVLNCARATWPECRTKGLILEVARAVACMAFRMATLAVVMAARLSATLGLHHPYAVATLFLAWKPAPLAVAVAPAAVIIVAVAITVVAVTEVMIMVHSVGVMTVTGLSGYLGTAGTLTLRLSV